MINLLGSACYCFGVVGETLYGDRMLYGDHENTCTVNVSRSTGRLYTHESFAKPPMLSTAMSTRPARP